MKLCPRCEANLSRRPAVSRTDVTTEICARCGTEESFELLRKELTPQEGWPVR